VERPLSGYPRGRSTIVKPQEANVGAVETNFFAPFGGPEERPGGYLPVDRLAASIVWALTQPPGVDVNTVTVRPIGSAT